MDQNFLFFDIECADGYNICSFGYVITDLDFKIINKEDIKINPKKKVLTNGRTPTDNFVLGYTDVELSIEPTFLNQYNKIKELLENPHHLIVGHSVSSDCSFLHTACKKNKVPTIKFKALDIQKVFTIWKKSTQQYSLKHIGEELDINFKEEKHTGLSGAILTAECFKALYKQTEFNSISIFKNNRYTVNSSENKKSSKQKIYKATFSIADIMPNLADILNKGA